MSYNSKDRFELIDCVRGVASIWILCFHMLPWLYSEYSSIQTFLDFGKIGTDFFYVTSGFVCAVAYQKIKEKKGAGFLKVRLTKIYKIYWLSLLFALFFMPLFWWFFSFLKGEPVLDFPVVDISEIFLFVTLLKVFSNDTWHLWKAFGGVNAVYHFLATLVQIFIFTRLAMYLPKYFNKILLIAFLASIFSLTPYLKPLIPIGLFLPKFCEFYLGFVLCWMIYGRNKVIFERVRPYFVIAGIVIFSFVIYSHVSASEGPFYRFLSALSIAILLFCLYPKSSFISNLPIFKQLSFVGGFSYSIYLNHILFYPVATIITMNIVNIDKKIAAPFLIVPVTVFLCYLFYILFEKNYFSYFSSFILKKIWTKKLKKVNFMIIHEELFF